MSVIGCIARELATDIAIDAAVSGLGALLGPLLGAEQTPPPPSPPKPAVTVSHQIKHSSFWAAVAGAVVGALASAAVYAAATALAGVFIVATGGLGAAVIIAIGVGATIAAGSAIDTVKSWVTDLVESCFDANDGPVMPPASPNVWIGGRPAARAGLDTVACVKHSTPQLIGEGSDSVIVNSFPLARIDDRTQCGAPIKQGVDTVHAGGEPVLMVDEIANEFPFWQRAIIVGIDYLIPPSRCMVQGARQLPRVLVKGAKNLAKGFKSGVTALKNGLKSLGKATRAALQKGSQLARQAANFMRAQLSKLKGALKSIWAGACKAGQKCTNNLRSRFDQLRVKFKPNPKCCPLDPVDTSTGAVVDERIDGAFGQTLRFELLRSYDSQRAEIGLLGRGWRDSLSEHLRLSHDGDAVEFISSDGDEITFAIGDDERVFNASAPHYTLIRVPRGFAIHDLRDDRTRHFETHGAVARLVRVSDAYNNHIDITYKGDLPSTVLHSDGARLELHRVIDDGGRTMLHIERCDASHLRRLATYTIAGGLLIEAESSSGFHFVYDYDAHGRLTRWSDGSKTANSYDYDERGRCVRAQGSGGFFVGTFEYLDDQQTCRVRTGRGHTTTYRFDGAHRLTSITSPLGHTESWAYDRHGQLIVETNAAGDAFHFRYDPVSGLLTRTIDPEGNSGEIHYDDDLRPIAFVDPAGHTWIYQRSERGAITSITDADDNTYRYTYNERGQTTAITRPDGLSRALTYDAHSRLVEETDWRGQTHRYTYDHQDRLIEARDAQGRADAFFYDPRDRLTALRHADGHQIRYEYDSEHNLTALTDENGHTTRAEYGAFDLHLATIDPEGRRYDFSYDPDHLLLTEVRAPDGRRYRLQRDAAGRVTHETDYHGATTHYQHDAAGRLIERRGAARQHLRYRYDRRGAVLAVEADGESTTFAYDQLGRLIRAANATTTLEWTYDALGRVTRAAQDGDVLEYTYDSSGRCVERTLRPGIWQKTAHTTHFTHDPAGQLTHLHLPCEQTLQIERDDLGRPTRLSTERGLQLDQEFDLRGALTRQHLTPSPSSRAAPLRRTYTYDPANNPRALDDARWGATQFSYDKSDRVIAAERPGPAAEHFRYGPAGQLAAADHPGAPVPFTFAPDGRLHRAGDTEHTYDDAGRLIARTLLRRGFRPARWTFTWDSHDRLIVAGTPDGHTWRYTYDPLGRRIRKFCPNTREAVLYLWDGDVLLREIHLQPRGPTHDQQVVKIVHWHHEPGTFHPLAREQDGEAHFVVTDHLGTPRELVDPSGQITWRARHTTWGALHPDPESDPTTCPIRFQGQYEDPETGLHYNRFRYYDPNTATYLTPDPLGLAGGLQPTAYVHNPNAWIDPLGLNGRRCKTLEKAFGNLETKAHQRGNSGIRTAMTRREADKLGKRWVGPNFTIQRGSNGEVFYVSSNGLRRYRPPTDKHSDYATTGRQANFEERNSTKSCWDKEGYDSNSVGNVHVHIKD